MSISLKELIGSADFNAQSKEIQDNLMTLLERINRVRSAWGKPMTVSSGLRTMEHHIEIYKGKAERAGVPFDMSKVPMKSRHLYGAAVDIADPDQELQAWCLANEQLLESWGLWMESFDATSSPSPWCHFQVQPYGSWQPGKSIFFNP